MPAGIDINLMEPLAECLKTMEANSNEKLAYLIDCFRHYQFSRAEYEWAIRMNPSPMSSAVPTSETVTSSQVQMPKWLLQGEQRMTAALLKFDTALIRRFDALQLDRRNLEVELATIRSESAESKASALRSFQELQAKYSQVEAELFQLRDVHRSLVAAGSDRASEHADLVATQNAVINDCKQQMFIQHQELAKLTKILEGYKRRVRRDGDFDEEESSDGGVLSPQSPVGNFDHSDINFTGTNSALHSKLHARVADLELRLDKQLDLNGRLKKLIQSNDHVKLVDDFNDIYQKNINLESLNKQLVFHLKVNGISIDDGGDIEIDSTVADLVDQRDAWKQNTRLLESQVFTLQQELTDTKSQRDLALNSASAVSSSTPDLNKHLRRPSSKSIKSSPQVSVIPEHDIPSRADLLASIKDLQLRPESRHFTILECPNCAPSIIIDI